MTALSLTAAPTASVLSYLMDVIEERDGFVWSDCLTKDVTEPFEGVSLFGQDVYVLRGPFDKEQEKSLIVSLGGGWQGPESLYIFTVKPSAALTKAVKAAGGTVTDASGKNGPDTIAKILKLSPTRLGAAAEALVVAHVGTEYDQLPGLLRGLQGGDSDDKPLTPDYVRPYLLEPGEVPVWSITDAIDKGNPAEALRMLHRVLRSSKPNAVLGIVTAHVEKMYRLTQAGITDENVGATMLGVTGSTYPVLKAIRAGSRRQQSLPLMYEMIGKAQSDLRGETGIPPVVYLEILIARLVAMPRR